MNMGENLVNENVTLEQLKENPAYSGYPEDILELMLVSGKMAKNCTVHSQYLLIFFYP